MTRLQLAARSLRHYALTGTLVALGVAVATAVIVGSLLVGASVRGSLRDTALARLGGVHHAITTPGLFRAALADDLTRVPGSPPAVAAVLALAGSARSPVTDAVTPRVSVYGVDDRFAQIAPSAWKPQGRAAAINQTLARDLGLRVGDELLVTVGREGPVAPDSIFARRKRAEVTRSLRVDVAAVLPDRGAGGFSLYAQALPTRNVFLSREWLADQTGHPGLANTLVTGPPPGPDDPNDGRLRQALRMAVKLEDHGIRVRARPGYASVESEGVTLTDLQADTAVAAIDRAGGRYAITSVTMATRLAPVGRTGPSAAYVVVAGTQPLRPLRAAAGKTDPGRDGIVLNRWLAQDLEARVGQRLALEYMAPTPDGAYPTRTLEVAVRGVVEMEGEGADPGLAPDFEGITDAGHIGDWDPPFPIEMHRVTDRDEAYWERLRAAPKAFVNPGLVREMWRAGQPGDAPAWVTSVRGAPPPGQTPAQLAERLRTELTAALTPSASGIEVAPVRRRALEASRGATDYGAMFAGMGLFLVAAAAGLAGMLMRLNTERRAAQAGIMQAVGVPPAGAASVLAAEGALLAVVGAAVGTPLGVAYAALLMRMLTTRWQTAVGQAPLWLHVDAGSIALGAVAGLLVGLASTAWGVARLRRASALQLLSGWRSMAALTASRPGPRFAALALLLAAAVALPVAVGPDQATAAFFGSGAALLAAALVALHLGLGRASAARGAPTLPLLAARNAATHRGQSVLTAGLLAAAAFILVTVAANARRFDGTVAHDRESGAGGFSLVARSSVPLPYDPSTAEGRRRLGFNAFQQAEFGTDVNADAVVIPFLVSPGEDISCLNIARPTAPRVLGVPDAMITRGGFTIRGPGGPRPWEALKAARADGTIPAFGDADSVMWQLHGKLGSVIEVPTSSGTARLRIVGLIHGSIFGGELLVSQEHFRHLYPDVRGPGHFLIDIGKDAEGAVAESWRRVLGDLGVDVRQTAQVLNELIGVQNTYLATFAALGGLGLLLGAVGLAVVLARGALERRRELALLAALGVGRGRVATLLALEVAGLLLYGLAAGTASALLAVAPHVLSTRASVDWAGLVALLGAIGGAGLLACALAARAAVRGSLVEALRAD